MSDGFNIQVSDEVSLVLKKTARLGPGDFRTAFRRIGNQWLRFIDEGFDGERDPYGNAWAPLSPRTVQTKTAEGSSHPTDILQDTGALRHSFSQDETRTGIQIGSDRVFEDGTTAEIHQFGGINAGGLGVPARPMLPFGDDLPPHWAQIAEGYLGDDIDNILRSA